MKEEELNTLRQQDSALRDALRLDEAELPQMPSDLNERLMQRVADEQKQPRKATVRRLWPWLAAACVAAFIAVNIAPPEDVAPQDKGQVAEKVEDYGDGSDDQSRIATVDKKDHGDGSPDQSRVATVDKKNCPRDPQPQIAEVKTVEKTTAKPRKQQLKSAEIEPKVDHGDSSPDPSLRSDHENRPHDLQLAQAATPKVKMQMLTEHDIPITRPENYKYTPEELAQLRKQADEAYLKWVELELEIAKHHLEQTAQQ